MRLHRNRTNGHAGMVLCSVDLDCAALAQRIHLALAATPELRNQVVRVNRPASTAETS